MKIIEFISKNKILTIGFIISVFIFIGHEIMWNIEGVTLNCDLLDDLLNNLSIGYMGCFVFYIIQVYIPENKSKKAKSDVLKRYINDILYDMEEPLKKIFNNPSVEDIENQINKDIVGLVNIIDIDVGSKIFRNGKELTLLEYMMEKASSVNNKINQIFLSMGTIIDTDLNILLHNILDSKYNKEVIERYNTPRGNQSCVSRLQGAIIIENRDDMNRILLEYMKAYISLYKELKNFMKKSFN